MSKPEKLIEGYKAFYQKYFQNDTSLYADLNIVGQRPKTLIVACSDSRVDPAILTQAAPGDIFIIRNVANLVPSYENGTKGGVGAALEFGVLSLNVEHIVVLGHSHCGGIKALVNDDVAESDFIGEWITLAAPAKARAIQKVNDGSEFPMQHQCERESIVLSLENLMSFPWIKDKITEGSLHIHGWYFDITDGTLQQYNPVADKFEQIYILRPF